MNSEQDVSCDPRTGVLTSDRGSVGAWGEGVENLDVDVLRVSWVSEYKPCCA